MDTVIFDTHQAVKAITRSGLDDTQAEAIVTTINKAMHQGLATKSDIVTLNTSVTALETGMKEVKSDILGLKVDMESVKADLPVLKWMVGLVIAVEVIPFLKFFT